MSDSPSTGQANPPERDAFASMLERLNEQLSRDVSQKILEHVPPEPEEKNAADETPEAQAAALAAAAAMATPVIPSSLPKPPLTEAQLASLSAEAMARATQAMKMVKLSRSQEEEEAAARLAAAQKAASAMMPMEPPGEDAVGGGMMGLLIRRKKLLIGLVAGGAVLAAVSLGISLTVQQIKPVAIPPAAASEAAFEVTSSDARPAEAATVRQPDAGSAGTTAQGTSGSLPSQAAAPEEPAPAPVPVPESTPAPAPTEALPAESGELPQLTPPPTQKAAPAPKPAPVPTPRAAPTPRAEKPATSVPGNAAPCTGARQALGLC